MKERIPQLPTWCLTGTRPAFYDVESSTAIEQTAKLYSTMQSLIEDYNKFADELNTAIKTFVEDSNADQEEFENHITKIVHDYIIMIDTKLELQDKEIKESITYISENLEQGITDVINQLVESGEIDEVVANAFEDMGLRVTSLESDMTNTRERVEHLENILITNDIVIRIDSIETKESEIESRIITLEENNTNLNSKVSNLESKKYYFDNVEMMKEYDLQDGDIVQTVGYYSVNDGGCATYKIVTSATADGYFVHQLSNGLFAELIIENNTVNIKQIGARPQDTSNNKYDIKEYIQAYLNYLDNLPIRFKLYIPSGVWHSSELAIVRYNGFDIYGDICFNLDRANGTIITSLNDNQEYIWQIGGDNTFTRNWGLNNITFSSSEFYYSPTYKSFIYGDPKQITGECLNLVHAIFGVTDNLFFLKINGKALKITSSWEIYFGLLNFRSIANLDDSIMTFGTVNKNINEGANISALTFEKLMFESVVGDLIECEKECKLLNSHFGVINAEDYKLARMVDNYTTFTNENLPLFNEDTAIHQSILNLPEGAYIKGVVIDSLELNNYSYRYLTINDKNYVYDTIVKISGNDVGYSVIINNISSIGMTKDCQLVRMDEEFTSEVNSIIVVNNLTLSNSKKFILNVKGAREMICNAKLKPFNYSKTCVGNEFNSMYNHVKNSSLLPKGLLYYDEESVNDLNIVVKPANSGAADQRVFSEFVMGGKSIVIRAKIPTDEIFTITAINPLTNAYYNMSLTGVGEYKYYTIDLSSKHQLGDVLRLTTSSSNVGSSCLLDVFKFID